MAPSLTPVEPLSQVVFVEDYFQLVFQAETLSVFAQAVLATPDTSIQEDQAGFRDAIVQLIGQRAEQIASGEPFALLLAFEAGATLRIHTSSGSGSEAFSFVGRGNLIVVENGA